MLISNGKQTRNISEKQLPEYQRKGYEPIKPEPDAPAKQGKPKEKAPAKQGK